MRRLLLSLGGSAAVMTTILLLKLGLSGTSTAALTGTHLPGAVAPGVASTAGADGSRTATGVTIDTPYGPVQVQVTATGTGAGRRITDVQALQLPDRDRHSQRLANYAAPILREEALSAQSADIGYVTGATYTSDAYAQSLSSALDALR
jgi:uncharacterized protein with FMN-binding domain